MNDEGTAPSLAAGAVPFLMCGEKGAVALTTNKTAPNAKETGRQ